MLNTYSDYDRCGIQTRDGAEPDSAMAADAAGGRGRVSQVALSLSLAVAADRGAFVISRALYSHVCVIGTSASRRTNLVVVTVIVVLVVAVAVHHYPPRVERDAIFDSAAMLLIARAAVSMSTRR